MCSFLSIQNLEILIYEISSHNKLIVVELCGYGKFTGVYIIDFLPHKALKQNIFCLNNVKLNCSDHEPPPPSISNTVAVAVAVF